MQKVVLDTDTLSVFCYLLITVGYRRREVCGGSEIESNRGPDAASAVHELWHPLSLSNGVMISNI